MVLINWEIQIWDNFEAYSRIGKALAGVGWGAAWRASGRKALGIERKEV